MISQQPLTRRIVIAFTLMTLVVSALFSISIVAIVFTIEEHLISQTLDRELHKVLEHNIDNDYVPSLPFGTRFYTTKGGESSIPVDFRDIKDGFSEIVKNDGAFYVYGKSIDNDHYILVQDQQDFEAHERTLHIVVVASFLLSVVVAWFLGWFVARRAISPLIHLSQQVRNSNANNPFSSNLANEYPDDEVGELAAAFDKAMNEIVQLLRREQLFTSDVSHELRTPLMIITSSCELLKSSTLDDRQFDQIQRISRATEDMHGLVKTFLILARSKFDKYDSSSTQTLETVADDLVSYWKPLIEEKGLTFHLIKNGTSPKVYNETLLNTTMVNLLRNALHYTEKGEIQLILEPSAFRVKDSGIGISDEDKVNIFNPFFRGKNTSCEGLGLGLSLVQRICTHQGWKVDIESHPNQGSIFTVSLTP